MQIQTNTDKKTNTTANTKTKTISTYSSGLCYLNIATNLGLKTEMCFGCMIAFAVEYCNILSNIV